MCWFCLLSQMITDFNCTLTSSFEVTTELTYVLSPVHGLIYLKDHF